MIYGQPLMTYLNFFIHFFFIPLLFFGEPPAHGAFHGYTFPPPYPLAKAKTFEEWQKGVNGIIKLVQASPPKSSSLSAESDEFNKAWEKQILAAWIALFNAAGNADSFEKKKYAREKIKLLFHNNSIQVRAYAKYNLLKLFETVHSFIRRPGSQYKYELFLGTLKFLNKDPKFNLFFHQICLFLRLSEAEKAVLFDRSISSVARIWYILKFSIRQVGIRERKGNGTDDLNDLIAEALTSPVQSEHALSIILKIIQQHGLAIIHRSHLQSAMLKIAELNDCEYVYQESLAMKKKLIVFFQQWVLKSPNEVLSYFQNMLIPTLSEGKFSDATTLIAYVAEIFFDASKFKYYSMIDRYQHLLRDEIKSLFGKIDPSNQRLLIAAAISYLELEAKEQYPQPYRDAPIGAPEWSTSRDLSWKNIRPLPTRHDIEQEFISPLIPQNANDERHAANTWATMEEITFQNQVFPDRFSHMEILLGTRGRIHEFFKICQKKLKQEGSSSNPMEKHSLQFANTIFNLFLNEYPEVIEAEMHPYDFLLHIEQRPQLSSSQKTLAARIAAGHLYDNGSKLLYSEDPISLVHSLTQKLFEKAAIDFDQTESALASILLHPPIPQYTEEQKKYLDELNRWLFPKFASSGRGKIEKEVEKFTNMRLHDPKLSEMQIQSWSRSISIEVRENQIKRELSRSKPGRSYDYLEAIARVLVKDYSKTLAMVNSENPEQLLDVLYCAGAIPKFDRFSGFPESARLESPRTLLQKRPRSRAAIVLREAIRTSSKKLDYMKRWSLDERVLQDPKPRFWECSLLSGKIKDT